MAKNDSASSSSKSSLDISWVWGPSRVYMVEYFTLLVALFVVLITGLNLFNEVLDAATDVDEGLLSTLSAISPFSYDATISLVATALVFTPAYGLLYLRTRKAERVEPKLKQNRKRRLLQYIFLVLTMLIMLGYGVSLVTDGLNWLINQDESGVIWQDIVKTIFAIGFLKLGFFMVLRQTEYATGGKK